jgi:hypothetical protein
MFEDSSKRLPRLSRAERGGDVHVLDRVEEALLGLKFGQVTVIVQNGVVVQVERTDRMRLPRSRSAP